MIKLSKRLQLIAEYVRPGSSIADIGSDHAYLPAYLCRGYDDIRAIAGEVQQGPYEAAIRTIEKHQLANQVQVRLGNGLEVIQTEDNVDTIIIAGMGGKLIHDILMNGLGKLKHVRRFILQPNTNTEYVRRFLLEQDIPLQHEFILEEHGHIYEVLIADCQSDTFLYDGVTEMDKQLLFGPLLMRQKPPEFRSKWEREYDHTLSIIEQLKAANQGEAPVMEELQMRKSWMEEVLR